MRWGVRRFQDYNGRLTSAGKKRYDKENQNGLADTESTSSAKRKGLTDKQKKALKVGAAVAVTALAAYGGYKLYKSGVLSSLADSGKSYVAGLGISTKTIEQSASSIGKLSHKESVEEAIANANPSKQGENCPSCVMATTLRMLGIDATAVDRVFEGWYTVDVSNVFRVSDKNMVDMTEPNVDRLMRQFDKRIKSGEYAEGDIGVLGLTWKPEFGRGHVMNWVIRNGSVEFIDGQVQLGHDFFVDFMKYAIDPSEHAEFIKLANVSQQIDLTKDVDFETLKNNVTIKGLE